MRVSEAFAGPPGLSVGAALFSALAGFLCKIAGIGAGEVFLLLACAWLEASPVCDLGPLLVELAGFPHAP